MEGQTLAERLGRGSLSIEEVLRFGLQICEALDRAHRQGVVHRDLKPGNIMLTKHGVKLLDFGLAKLGRPGPSHTNRQQSHINPEAPTRKEELTEEGTILGTTQYMAPEQLEGKEADARTDIFAFGTVLYEMASGKKAFSGTNRASLIAAILTQEPERLSQIAPLTAPALDRVVAACLAKDPDERWQTTHDLKWELKWISEGAGAAALARTGIEGYRRRLTAAWGVAAMLALFGGYAGFTALQRPAAPPSATRLELAPPANLPIHSIAFSPNGRQLAVITQEPEGRRQFWIRSMDSDSPQPVAASDDAAYPFWSPDGRAVAFFGEGALRKFELNSRAIVSLCKAHSGRGGSWSPKGTIVFTPYHRGPLHRVPATGGESEPITELDKDTRVLGHRWPWFLPDGEHFLYWAEIEASGQEPWGGIFVGSLAAPKQARLLTRATENGIYAAGHVLYVNRGTLMAAPFDPKSKAFLGASFPVAESLRVPRWRRGMSIFWATEEGTLAYLPAGAPGGSAPVWYSLEGAVLGQLANVRTEDVVALSRDSKTAAYITVDQAKTKMNLWIYDIERGSSMLVTTDPHVSSRGVWSPDGQSIAFGSSRNGTADIYCKDVSSAQPERLLWRTDELEAPQSWSQDGKLLLFTVLSPKTRSDIWILSLDKEPPEPEPFLNSEYHEEVPCFSPNGKWIAYTSDELGVVQIFALSFPGKRGKVAISTAGGGSLCWAPDGTKIYYLDPENYIVEVGIRSESERLMAGMPKRLFQIQRPGLPASFDIAPDGKKFLVTAPVEPTNGVPLKVVLNWPAGFRERGARK